MSQASVPLERLIVCIKERMQHARQQCPFFQLEQRAIESCAPHSLETGLLPQTSSLFPEICRTGLDGAPLAWTEQQQSDFCRPYQGWFINVDSSFFSGSHVLLEQLRSEQPGHYLIARDFVVDEYQILQARMAGANALTLSNALLGIRRTQLYFNKIRFWEMEPVLEVHSLDDARLALELKARMVVLSPLPGNSRSWHPADLEQACLLLGDIPLLLYSGLSLPPKPGGIHALALNWQLWQSPDPAAELATLEQSLTKLSP